MLSILVPVFNFDCSDLVLSLHFQASAARIEFEILLYDDCSTRKQELNPSVFVLDNLKYRQMSANLGRSAIRNLLASEALYDNLLFIDCDCLPANNEFIKRYLNAIGIADCICGGTIYPDRKSIDNEQILHWTYGTKREIKVNQRVPPVFVASNFLTRKSIFANSAFDTTIKGYGHEDTLFGLTMSREGFTLSHISNPVVHFGLHDSKSFLANTAKASANLRLLFDNPLYCNALSDIRLIKTYQFISQTGLHFVLRRFGKWLIPALVWQLKTSKPSMRILDIYKLISFC
jgi:glycosyltransferase involved in cell wall biosynthesis